MLCPEQGQGQQQVPGREVPGPGGEEEEEEASFKGTSLGSPGGSVV